MNCHALLFFAFAYPVAPEVTNYLDQFRGKWAEVDEQGRRWGCHVQWLADTKAYRPEPSRHAEAVGAAKRHLRYWELVAVALETSSSEDREQSLSCLRMLLGDELYATGWSPPRLGACYPKKKLRVVECAHGLNVVED